MEMVWCKLLGNFLIVLDYDPNGWEGGEFFEVVTDPNKGWAASLIVGGYMLTLAHSKGYTVSV
jgi:hypothetical protein